MDNIAYYHCYLTDNPSVWSSMFMEQMKYAEDSGLLDNLTLLKINAITQNDDRITSFVNLCNSYPVRTQIRFTINTVGSDNQMVSELNNGAVLTEAVTLSQMLEDAHLHDFNMLYFHSKGITSFDRHFTNEIDTYKKYHYWRHYLNWGVLEKWKECIKALDKYDISGVNYCNDPEPHYSGNFWWTKSSYVRNLPEPKSDDWWFDMKQKTTDHWIKSAPSRYKDEYWITRNPGFSAFNLKGAEKNPAFTLTPRKLYT